MSINYPIEFGHKYVKYRTMKTINFILFITLFSLNSFAQVVLADNEQLTFQFDSENPQEVVEKNITANLNITTRVKNDDLRIQMDAKVIGNAQVFLYNNEGSLLGSGKVNIDKGVQIVDMDIPANLDQIYVRIFFNDYAYQRRLTLVETDANSDIALN